MVIADYKSELMVIIDATRNPKDSWSHLEGDIFCFYTTADYVGYFMSLIATKVSALLS